MEKAPTETMGALLTRTDSQERKPTCPETLVEMST